MNKENVPRPRANKFGYRGSVRKSSFAGDAANAAASDAPSANVIQASALPSGSDQGLKSLLDSGAGQAPVVAMREARPAPKIRPLKERFVTTPDNIVDACKTIRDKYGSFKEKESARKEAQRLLKETWSVTIPSVLEQAVQIEDELLAERENLVLQIMSLSSQRTSLVASLEDVNKAMHAIPLLEKKLADSDKSRKTLQGVLNVITESKERAERDNEAFRSAIQEHRGIQTELETHLTSVQYELEKRERHLSFMQESLKAEHARELEEVAAESQTLLNEQQAKSQHEIRRLKADHAREIEAKDNLITVTSGRENGANQRIVEMQSDLDDLSRQNRDCISDFEKERIDMKATIERLRNDLSSVTEQRQALQLSLDSERQTFMEKDKQLEVGMRTFETTQRSMEQEKQQLLEEKRDLQRALTEQDSKLENFRDLQQQATFQDSELTSVRRELEHFKTLESDAAGERDQTQSEKLKLEGQLTLVKEQLEKSMKELQSLRDEYSRASESITVERVYLQSEANRLKDEKVSGTQKLEKEIIDLRQELESVANDLTSIRGEHDEALSELKVLRESGGGGSGGGAPSSQQVELLTRLQVEADQLRRQLEQSQKETSAVDAIHHRQKDLEEKLFHAENERRRLHNIVQDLRGNVRVFVRVRPSVCETDFSALRSIDRERLCIASEGFKDDEDGLGAVSNFQFDRVFGGDSNQSDVFGDVVDLIQSSLDGYNVCLFSYGQTGSGKTFTMEGTGDGPNRGLIPRSAEKIMEETMRLRPDGWEHTISASFVEIYNEELRDLLVPAGSKQRQEVSIKMRPDGKPQVAGLVEETVDRIDHVHEIISKAGKNRAVASTDMNARSSRSHSIFILRIKGFNAAKKISLSGTLNLCDLAGSERLAKSHATGDRLRETQAINKSLSALVDVFDALKRKNSHIPFRNSKLTYLLQDCLSGDGKTMMLVNLSPDVSSSNESLCSLKFASQVNQTELGKAKRQIENGNMPTATPPQSSTPRSSLSSTPRSQPRRAVRSPVTHSRLSTRSSTVSSMKSLR